MIITIHRGSHEIGGTCIEMTSRSGTRILLDLGQPLPPLDETVDEPRPELALPAVKGLYQSDGYEKLVDGLLVSHAHQDHYGLMKNLHPEVTCHISEPTRQLIESTALFTGNGVHIEKHRPFHSGEVFAVGDFKITPFLVDHSAFDAHAFLIEDGVSRVFYSGDFRGHGRKAKLFEHFVANPPAPVDVLLMEGTMLARASESCDTEQELEQKIVDAVEKAQGLVLSSVSGQNIDRLVTLFRVAKRTKRILVVDPYVAYILDQLAAFNPSLPHPSAGFQKNLSVYYPQRLCHRMNKYLGLGPVLDKFSPWRVKADRIRERPDRYLLLVRDSMTAELQMELGEAAHGALFLYGMWKGYWDRVGMQNLKNWVEQAGMRFQYAHTSGHAVTADLKRLARALRPVKIVPIHTTCPDEYETYFEAPVTVAQDGVPIVVGE